MRSWCVQVLWMGQLCPTLNSSRLHAAPVTEQPHHPRQGDLTMEERDRLMALLIAVGDETYARCEDPELGELVEQLMDRLLEGDTLEVADDAREIIPRLNHLRCGTARRFDLTIDDSEALRVGTQWRPCAGPGPGHHCAVAVKGSVRLSA